MRIAVVATRLGGIVDYMLKFIEEWSQKYEAEITGVFRVPGLLETPLVVKKILESDSVDGVIVLGAILKETSLEEYLFNQVISKLLDLSLAYEKPIGFGIAGPGVYWDSRLLEEGGRAYAKMALEAVKKTAEVLRSIGKQVHTAKA